MNAALFRTLFGGELGKGEAKKVEIIEGTIELIAAEGAFALSLDRVAKRLGLRRSHVAYYFESLEDLFEATMKLIESNAQQITVDGLRKESTPEGRLRAYIAGPFDWARKYPSQVSAVLLLYHLSVVSPRFQRLNRGVRLAGEERVRAILDELGRHDAERAARAIQDLITGRILGAVTTGLNRAAIDLARAEVTALAETFARD